ncbi:hypothetical protein BASA81_012731 [Batrachochytrium salamandrivorans]|nr:hypothetical protein BASA81_012731 [Batrachochytrium salamandrivorans]
MIVHDYALFHGWGALLHVSGSALYNYQSIVPALFSAGLAALIANCEPVYAWLNERVVSGTVVFSGIQFLVSLIVVNRVWEASIRFAATQESYGRLNSCLQRLALFFTCAMEDSENMKKKPEEMNFLRMRFLRWIRAIHVLALEEFQGFETPKYRMGTLSFTEEIVLFRESRRTFMVIRWLVRGYTMHRLLIAPSISTDIKMQGLLDELGACYANTVVISNGIYPFPLAQTCLMTVLVYALWSPLAFGIMLPNSYFLAPLICFTSVWLSVGANLAAQMLEWPFDGKANDLPLKYYSVRFVKEMGELEFGIDVPMVNLPLKRVLQSEEPSDGVVHDYVIPTERNNLCGSHNTQDWLHRACKDMESGLKSRRKLRHTLKQVKPRPYADTGISLSEIRASGIYRTLL